MSDEPISIRTFNPEEFAREVNVPESSFNKYNGDFIKSHQKVVEDIRGGANQVQRMASEGVLPPVAELWNAEENLPDDPALAKKLEGLDPWQALAAGKSVSIDKLGMKMEDMQAMKAGVYNLWLTVTVPGSDEKPVELDSREFIAWQRDGAKIPADEWARKNDIALMWHEEPIQADDQNILIEWKEGQRRIVGDHKALPSEKRSGYYGELVISGPDKKPVHDQDGLPDIFLTKPVYEQIKKGEPYRGKVVFEDLQKKDGSFDEIKIFLGTENEQASRDLEASSFAKREDFDSYVGKSKYHTVSAAQFQAWQYDTAKHPENASMSFEDWTNKNWGGRERFDGVFNGMTSLTGTQYSVIAEIASGKDGIRGNADDPSSPQVQAALLRQGSGGVATMALKLHRCLL
ncbi:MAG: hypothetical protein AB7L92_06100 [Alphaproteobacteria bacterium]